MKRILILLTLVLTACAPLPAALPPQASPPTPTPVPGLRSALDGGVGFLAGQYNPAYGLLQESPAIGQHRFYLTNDNALAATVLERLGKPDLARPLRNSLTRYGYDRNGFVEVAWGEVIPWPPIHHKDVAVDQLTDAQCDFLNEEESGPVGDCVLQETHTPDLGLFYDWSSFSNLACMGSVNAYNMGEMDTARFLYRAEMATFDGLGFPDLAWVKNDGAYETLGLAWCLYAGALIGEPVNQAMLDSLLAQQDPTTGGFHTHFQADAVQLADPNVETTSVALLALGALSGVIQPGTLSPVLGFPADAPRPNP